jgi:hypothetical protein
MKITLKEKEKCLEIIVKKSELISRGRYDISTQITNLREETERKRQELNNQPTTADSLMQKTQLAQDLLYYNGLMMISWEAFVNANEDAKIIFKIEKENAQPTKETI